MPQGSILGPFLYLKYTSNTSISNCIITAAYADDNCFYVHYVTKPFACNSELGQHMENRKVISIKSQHISFTYAETSASVSMNNTATQLS